MRISYNWLQSFFTEKLPTPEKVRELFTMHAFEVESVEAITRATGPDWILDVKVTPNRAHDCLSHRGVARELAALLDTKIDEQLALPVRPLPRIAVGKPQRVLNVEVDDPKLCRRYMGRVLENIAVRESPEWLRDALIAIAQKPINNVVDVANFVMFHIGQPLHAFDAEKLAHGDVSPTIIARYATHGEEMTTLDQKQLKLTTDDFVLSDGESILGLTGVKGGVTSGISATTKHVVLESANFTPGPIRRSAQRAGIRTDASHRFENDISPELVGEAMDLFTRLLLVTAKTKKTKVGPVVDWYPRKRKPYTIGFTKEDVANILGSAIEEKEIVHILNRLTLPWKKVKPRDEVLRRAPACVGAPYRGYGVQISYDAPEAFDCSSLTGYLFAQAGVAIPRMSIDQYFFGTPVDMKDIEPGDLIFSNTHDGGDVKYYSLEYMTGRKLKEGLDHLGLYLGGGKILHASRHNGEGKVVVEKLKEADLFKDIVGVRRMLPNNTEHFVVTVPELRLDLRRKEDVVEEIGRLYGYEKIEPMIPREVLVAPAQNPSSILADTLRDLLVGAGYSEAYLYTLVDKGELELANSFSREQRYLRCSLMAGLEKAVQENLKYYDEVKLFEIGHAFLKNASENGLVAGLPAMPAATLWQAGETNRLAIGIGTKRKLKAGELFYELKGVLELVSQRLRVPLRIEDDYFVYSDATRLGWVGPNGYGELHLDILQSLPRERVQFTPISRYPSITRDIALFVPGETKVQDAQALLLSTAGALVVSSWLFDTFEKEGKKSLAFRLVFQSRDRTLEDAAVNDIMVRVSAAAMAKGWTVR